MAARHSVVRGCCQLTWLEWWQAPGCWGLEQGHLKSGAGLNFGWKGGAVFAPHGDNMLKLKYLFMCGCYWYLKF